MNDKRSELKSNAKSLAQHVMNSAPPGMGVVIIFYDRKDAIVECATSARDPGELTEILRSLLDDPTRLVS